MILFFVSDLTAGNCFLEEDEFQHCCKVLRHKIGDIISVTNGLGEFGKAKIERVLKASASLSIVSIESKIKPTKKIVLAIAPPKTRSRWEFLLEKAVEIGVDTIIPMTTGNSERIKFNLERCQKIMRSASLQSMRIIHPTILELSSFNNIVEDPQFQNTQKLIGHYHPNNSDIRQLKTDLFEILILIGPEGDFNASEIEKAKKNGFRLVNISSNRLRTETAALVGIDLCIGMYLD